MLFLDSMYLMQCFTHSRYSTNISGGKTEGREREMEEGSKEGERQKGRREGRKQRQKVETIKSHSISNGKS